MRRWRPPAPPAVFVGRDREVARLRDALSRISVGVVYGVAGVGKSALVHTVASAWSEHAVYARASAAPLATLVDDARRQLARGAVSELVTDEEKIADLVERLEAEPAMWVVDDLHAVDGAGAETLVRALSKSLREGRFLATSRHKLPRRPGDPDRLELTLEGLDEPAARELWRALDELYGPSSGVESALARAAGNPFRLRHAHAGGLDDEDLIAATLEGFDDDVTVAAAIALAGHPLPTALIEQLVGAEAARAALRRLVARLVVEVDGAGAASVHRLFADALVLRLGDERRRALHDRLAGLVPHLGLDRIAEVRERARVRPPARPRERLRHPFTPRVARSRSHRRDPSRAGDDGALGRAHPGRARRHRGRARRADARASPPERAPHAARVGPLPRRRGRRGRGARRSPARRRRPGPSPRSSRS